MNSDCSASRKNHPLKSGYESVWDVKNLVLLEDLPSEAIINSSPYSENFSYIFCIAELLLDTTCTVLPEMIMFAMILSIVCVFPVPGGPSITLSLFSNAFFTALN